jgi:putative transposase
MNSAAFRDLPPKQIVPQLADCGRYLASESTMYRLLRAEGQLVHRGRAKPPTRREVKEHAATAPNQVWSWDITYLKSALRGSFHYLYMVEDVWSRKIVGWAIHEEESMDLAAPLMRDICMKTGVDVNGLVLHSDNGGPMKGSTMLATLQRLGVVPSFSRPGVSDDNPFSEALFRTMKYRPGYPGKPFASIEHARAWVTAFASSRPTSATPVATSISSRNEPPSTSRQAGGTLSDGHARREIGRPSAPCTSIRSSEDVTDRSVARLA